MISAYAPSYVKFSEPNGEVYGAYGARLAQNIKGVDMMAAAVDRLTKSRDTRQCVVSMWRPDDLTQTGRKDMPCTLSWQFLVRDARLHMITSMRSNDVWLGMPNDIYVNTCVQRLLAMTLGLGVGTYTHFAGSLHLYERNYEAAVEAWGLVHRCDWVVQPTSPFDTLDNCAYAVALEKKFREGDASYGDEPLGVMLHEAVMCAASKWHPELRVHVTSPALMKGLELCSSSKDPT